MIRTVNLINYLPHYLREYREIQQIIDVENPELQLAFDITETITNNQFITTSDIDGIQKYEYLCGINPDITSTLQDRIARVLFYWNDKTPYTYRVLVAKLDELHDDYIIITDFNNYAISFKFNVNELSSVLVEDIDYLLDYMIPANLIVSSVVEKSINLEPKYFIGTAIKRLISKTASSDISVAPPLTDKPAYPKNLATKTVTKKLIKRQIKN